LTMTSCGTPAWAAPEVLQTQRYSLKADVYSFAICLWEMCTRQIPYDGIPPYQIVISVATKRLRPDTSSIGISFREIIVLCWEEEPSKRPPFDELSEKLKQMECPLPDSRNPKTSHDIDFLSNIETSEKRKD